MASLRRSLFTLATATAVGLTLAAAPLAHADSKNWHKVLSPVEFAPFNLAVSQNKVYVAEGFNGTIGVVGQDPLVAGPEAAGAAGIDVTADGKTIAWTWTEETGPGGNAGLTVRTRGKADVTTNLAAAEANLNPDQVNTYGVLDYGTADQTCVDAALAGFGGATYPGQLDSHPYSVVRAGSRWVVADAGANNLWSVSDAGVATNLSVLPPQPLVVTADMVPALEAAYGVAEGTFSCLPGVTYAFEPVPTDVEVAPNGTLWVTVLPGGPEGPALGARGAVYTVNPRTGEATLVAGGFAGATNLAVAPDGTVYVTELFGGKISSIDRKGNVSTAAEFERPLSVEVAGGYLYVGQLLDFENFSPGSIVRLKR